MDANTQYWISRVALKLNKLFLSGYDFEDGGDYFWVFDWNEKLSYKENMSGVFDEDKALTLLTRLQIIKSRRKDNFYLQQHEEGMALRGFGPWGRKTVGRI